MADNEIRNTGSFAVELTSTSGTAILPILDVGAIYSQYENLSIDYYLGSEFFLESLQVTVNLTSFVKAPIPNIAPEDTQAERQVKLYNVQENYPKIGLALMKAVGAGAYKRQSLPVLQNPGNEWYLPLLVPYLTMSEVKLLGRQDKLGVQLTNFGDGLLGFGDTLLIEGSWRQTLTLTKKQSQPLSSNSFGADVGESTSMILPSQSKRGLLWLCNAGDKRVWFDFNSNVIVGDTAYLDPGSTANLDCSDVYFPSALYARTETGTSRLTGIEGIKT